MIKPKKLPDGVKTAFEEQPPAAPKKKKSHVEEEIQAFDKNHTTIDIKPATPEPPLIITPSRDFIKPPNLPSLVTPDNDDYIEKISLKKSLTSPRGDSAPPEVETPRPSSTSSGSRPSTPEFLSQERASGRKKLPPIKTKSVNSEDSV